MRTAWCLLGVALSSACATPAIPRPKMTWIASPHCRKGGRTPSTVDAIAIHTTEGRFLPGRSHASNQLSNYYGTINYFRNNSRNVSAHFVIGPHGEITQMVEEVDIAHTTTYYNARSFGIECAGWGARAETWSPQMLNSLVELCAYLCVRWEIPVVHPVGTAYDSPHAVPTRDPKRPRFDAPGIVGHFQVQPWNKKDPGEHFPWDDFMRRLRARIAGL